MVTLCDTCTDLRVYLSLLLQHFVSLLSAQLIAADCWETEPAHLVQRPHQFPSPLSEISGNERS